MNVFKVNNKYNIGDLIISLIITLGGATVIGWFTSNLSKTQYNELVKPVFAPPSWVFEVIWPVLYILMSIAAYRIYQLKKQGVDVGNALKLYAVQLILNFIWPFIFFAKKLYGISFIEIVILWMFILLTFLKFLKLDKRAGLLLIPYILWVTFAAILNFFIWALNEM
ncbi:tryptophan-rich sensory protein [Clostridium polyendosporum]|uniref:Tryptophan-rich sensory protein n=1 Tax=Clostridium polyendosporum TaxID=69208 RepID=A0A919VD69_9CLOT|nr:TspO/MBR family protein [Clostridium polyendosporum]GIM27674.1 tryptophan-rich sensory protein [Clostridium polyendosporum]